MGRHEIRWQGGPGGPAILTDRQIWAWHYHNVEEAIERYERMHWRDIRVLLDANNVRQHQDALYEMGYTMLYFSKAMQGYVFRMPVKQIEAAWERQGNEQVDRLKAQGLDLSHLYDG